MILHAGIINLFNAVSGLNALLVLANNILKGKLLFY
jgi:hypothetical protein